ncbi:MAG: 50S ribosomal protein L16 [Candidatus Woesearchaeota archaeon]
MAGLRKGHCYSKVKRPYTRKSKVRSKSFIKTIPQNRIVRYHMGDQKKEFKYKLELISKQDIQIRHNAIESCRLVVNRRLHNNLGLDYLFNILVYPHHILRENKMLAGAGADRMQKGMQHSFGRPIGLAAQVKKGKTVFSILVNENNLKLAKQALKMATPRMPGQYTIQIQKITDTPPQPLNRN